MTWQPIDTAPRDGTAILAGSVNHDAREVVCWQDGQPSGSMIDDQPEEGWVNAGAVKDRFYANPRWFTHWMPLPPAPCALTADFTQVLPGGKLDDATYEKIEDALDRADAPCRLAGRWLTLPERVTALASSKSEKEGQHG